MSTLPAQNASSSQPINRRQHERFTLPTAYTPIAIRRLDSESFDVEGHAYDVSEGGMRFELDEPIAPGTSVAVRLELPGLADDGGPGRAIFVTGNIVWIDEEEIGLGPVRMAVAFTAFSRVGDRERLLRQLGAQRYLRAA